MPGYIVFRNTRVPSVFENVQRREVKSVCGQAIIRWQVFFKFLSPHLLRSVFNSKAAGRIFQNRIWI